MAGEVPGDRSARVNALQAYARDRLGAEIQAISYLGFPVRTEEAPDVWHVMMEVGTFWLAERAGVVELFASTAGGLWRRDAMRCPSPRHAARRFLEFHPDLPEAGQCWGHRSRVPERPTANRAE